MFTVNGSETFAIAGLWDQRTDKLSGTSLLSYTVITTTPNELTSQVHNRMPVILHERDRDEWLLREGPATVHLIQSFPAGEMAMRPVSKDDGDVRNNQPELLNSR